MYRSTESYKNSERIHNFLLSLSKTILNVGYFVIGLAIVSSFGSFIGFCTNDFDFILLVTSIGTLISGFVSLFITKVTSAFVEGFAQLLLNSAIVSGEIEAKNETHFQDENSSSTSNVTSSKIKNDTVISDNSTIDNTDTLSNTTDSASPATDNSTDTKDSTIDTQDKIVLIVSFIVVAAILGLMILFA